MERSTAPARRRGSLASADPEQTRAAQAALASTGVPLLIHQPRYSMFDRHIEDGLFPVLDELGTGCIVFSPLAQGLLTDRYLDGTVPDGSRAATSRCSCAGGRP